MLQKNTLISDLTQQEMLDNCYIKVDRSEFEGQTYSSAPFYKQFDTKQYLFEVFGTIDITWRNHEDYDFDRVSSISVTMYDDLGEVFPDEEVYDTIQKNLQFSII
jgi:hypothetical protein